jgi:hypothetical protein
LLVKAPALDIALILEKPVDGREMLHIIRTLFER